MNETTNPDVVVIGGGLAGLTAAAILARAGKKVVVYEKLATLGGDARSVDRDGFTFNQGPHALYQGGPAERVLTEIGIKIRGGRPPTKGGLVVRGRVEIAPSGPLSLLRTNALTMREKIEVAKNLARLPRLRPDEFNQLSVNEWIADSVESERASEMMHALVRLGTYSNQPDILSADVAIAQMQSALGEGVYYLDGGWQSLVDQLAAFPGVHIVTGRGIDELPDSPMEIIAAGGPSVASRLLGTSFDVGPPAHASCLDLGLRREPDVDFIIGCETPFYFSNHSAVADLAPDGSFHGAAIQYLADGDEPNTDAMMAFAGYAGIRDEDVIVSRRLHRMTPSTSIPTRERGGMAGRPGVTSTGHANVFLAGDWVGSVGHLADASIASAEAAAQSVLAVLSK